MKTTAAVAAAVLLLQAAQLCAADTITANMGAHTHCSADGHSSQSEALTRCVCRLHHRFAASQEVQRDEQVRELIVVAVSCAA